MTIPYDDALKAKHGNQPNVLIFFRDPSTMKYRQEQGLPFFSKTFDGSNIFIDFGGPATGIVKIT